MKTLLTLGIVSDCHLEFGNRKFIIPEGIDVIISAGDFHTSAGNAIKALRKLRKQTNLPIVYIAGNHEFYGKQYPKEYSKYHKLFKEVPDLYFLEKESVVIKGIRFLGTTLWSDISNPIDQVNVIMSMNDYTRIKQNDKRLRLNPTVTTQAFEENKKWLISELEKKELPTVVVTHHSPTRQTTHPAFKGDPINCAYSSDLDNLLLDYSPLVWIHGHHHDSQDVEIGKTKVISNPIGYPHQGDKDKIKIREFRLVKTNQK